MANKITALEASLIAMKLNSATAYHPLLEDCKQTKSLKVL